MQPNNNRTQGPAGEPAGTNAGEGAFEPGDSFSDEPSEQGLAGELPSWLQNFAGTAGEPGGPGSPDVPAATPASQSQPSIAATQTHALEERTAQIGQIPVSGDSSFFSEDDLPEWLRALSADSEPAAGAASAVTIPTESVTPNGAILVPPVTRAWVTASDQAEVSPGANLLSSLVNVIDSRPEAVAVESTVSAPTSPANARAGAKSQPKAPVASEPTTATTPPTSSSTRDAGRWSRTRMLSVLAIIVLLLLVIVLFLS